MKLTVINASPRIGGFTDKITDIFVSGFRDDTEIIKISMLNIHHCTGCDYCRTNKHCRFNDTEELFEKIEKSDYIVFASPVYNYSFPSQMKAFLDRLQPYFSNPVPINNCKGFLLVTCGCSGKYSAEIMNIQAKTAFSELGINYCGSYLLNNTDKLTSLQDDDICKVKQLASEFFSREF